MSRPGDTLLPFPPSRQIILHGGPPVADPHTHLNPQYGEGGQGRGGEDPGPCFPTCSAINPSPFFLQGPPIDQS